MIRKILCPICFSTRIDPMLRAATHIARLTGAELVIVDAWHWLPLEYAGDAGVLPRAILDTVADKQQTQLALAVRRCKRAGVERVTSRMLAGVPSLRVLEMLETEAFDLVVLGVEQPARHGGYRMGASAKHVFHRAPCSVLITNHSTTVERFENVLCPIDDSEASRAAVELACDLVEHTGRLTLLHAGGPGGVRLARLADDVRATTGVEVMAVMRSGEPMRVVVDMVAERNFDLVVIAAREDTSIRAKLLGSPHVSLVRHMPCAVLFAHPRADPAPMLRALR